MTEKELHKLRRQDLLQLLLEQGKEAVQLGSQLTETEQSLNQVQSGNDRLKSKLDDKDEQIERLKSRLDEKDAMINKLKSRLDEKDARIHDLNTSVQDLQAKREVEIDEIIKALKIDGLLELIQQASNQYMLRMEQARAAIVEAEPPLAIGAAREAEAPESEAAEPAEESRPVSSEEPSEGEASAEEAAEGPETPEAPEALEEPEGAEESGEPEIPEEPGEREEPEAPEESEEQEETGKPEEVSEQPGESPALPEDASDTPEEERAHTAEKIPEEDFDIEKRTNNSLRAEDAGESAPVKKKLRFWQRWRRSGR